MQYVDLSVAINNDMPVDPADEAPKVTSVASVEQEGYSLHEITIGSHIGTHIDAPMHMVAGGKSLDTFAVENFVGRGCYIDVTNKEFDLEKIKAAGVQAGDIVLLHTGMHDQYNTPAYFASYPPIPEDIAQYFVDQKVKMVGMDMCGPDHEPYNIHKILLGGNVLIIENLMNLQELAGKIFTVYALPIKLQVDGAPARVIAVTEDSSV